MPNPIVKPGMMVYDVDRKRVGWVRGDVEEYTHEVRVWTIEWADNRYTSWAEGSVLRAHQEFKKFAKEHEKTSCRAGNNAV